MTLAAALLGMQALCWLLARGLGLRLKKHAILAAWVAPLLMLAPWLGGNPLLVPCDILQEGIPGAPPIAGQRQYDLLNDVVYQILPWELEVRHALSSFRLPLWSDSLEGGSSPWANPQAGVLSPLQMAARAFPIQHHILGTLALKILVAFQGTWLLARLAGRSRAASLLAAAGFSLGGGLFSWALFPVSAAAAWMPWLAAGTVRLFRWPGRRAVATTAAIAAILLLSGHPETAAFGGLFAGVCGLGLRRRRAGLGRGLGAAVLAALLGFGLAAPHILPFLHAVPKSQRAHETLAHTAPTGNAALSQPLSWFAPGFGKYMLAPTSPHAYGRPYRDPFRGPINWPDSTAGYTGLVAFAGAWLALLAARDRRALPFLLFALAGLLTAAQFLPLANLLHTVPPLRVPAYSRLLMAVALALSVAGAFGIDLLLSRRRRGRWILAATWGGLALAALVSLAVAADAWTAGLWISLAVACGVCAVCARTRLHPLWGAAALGMVLLADLVPWSRSHLPGGHPSLFYPRTEALAVVGREAGPPESGRAAGWDYLVYPNLLPVYGIADFRPHNPLAPEDQIQVLNAAFGFRPTMSRYFAPVSNADHPLLDFLGVRVLVGSAAMPASRTLERIDGGRFSPYTLLRNPDALPRWFLPRAVDAIPNRGLDRWIAALDDPWRVAVFREEAGSWRPAPRPGEPPVPRVASSSPGRVILDVPPGSETLLASSLAWSEGWSSRSGDRMLRTLRVNGAYLGVRLPVGISRVELRFLPPGFISGIAACVLCLAAVLLMLALPRAIRPEGRASRPAA